MENPQHRRDDDDSTEVRLAWVGSAGKTAVILFSAAVAHVPGATPACKRPSTKSVPSKSGPLRLAFKAGEGDTVCTVVRSILLGHGFSEVSTDSCHFNLMWTGLRMKSYFLRRLQAHQKINHFPSSYELTKKNLLCDNVQRMQQSKGVKHFNIIPKTFVLPQGLTGLLTAFRKHRGTWIVKPGSLSRGRGISLINHPNQLPQDRGGGTIVVSRYVDNPLCIDGFKFDVRLYVAVTSFNPLRIYLYEEGLTRFATVQYQGASQQLGNLCMHLTNYSVNKLSANYVRCEDPDVEDFGNKWSMSAMLRYLKEEGVDVGEVMMRVEDVIIKTILCGEVPIVAACKTYQSHRGNCFELYGFDILIDENLQPWVLEVNLSPSLACDAPLDFRLKSNLVADLLSLVGIAAQDAFNGERKTHVNSSEFQTGGKRRPRSGGVRGALSAEEAAVLRETKEEHDRRGGYVRIFPSYHSWELYGSFIDAKPLNLMLHSQLYPDNVKAGHTLPSTLASVNCKRFQASLEDSSVGHSPQGLVALERVAVYLRKLKGSSSHAERAPRVAPDPPAPVADCRTHEPVPLQQHAASSSTSNDCVTSNSVLLSKLQARQVFASYLDHVQGRLLKETSGHVYQQTETEEDQKSVDLVIRFLSKASANLKSPFSVVVPDKQLSLSERKRILAKKLAEFVELYKEETCLLVDCAEVVNHGLSTEAFKTFLSLASEAELEKVLAHYAQQNKSSSAFVSTSAKAIPRQHHDMNPSQNGMHQRTTTDVERAPQPPNLSRTDSLKYSPEMLPASGLPLSYQNSLEQLTKSLAGWQTDQSSALSNHCSRLQKISSPAAYRTTSHKRSPSGRASARIFYEEHETLCQSKRPASATLQWVKNMSSGSSSSLSSKPASKPHPYSSPYARTALYSMTHSKQVSSKKKTKALTPSLPPSKLPPAVNVDSSTQSQALHKLTLRQNARKYAASSSSLRRPVATQAWVEPPRGSGTPELECHPDCLQTDQKKGLQVEQDRHARIQVHNQAIAQFLQK